MSISGGKTATLVTTILGLLERNCNTRCVVLDGRKDIDIDLLTKKEFCQQFHQVRLLSMANCQKMVPVRFFGGSNFANLLHLDISYNNVWAQNTLGASDHFKPAQLPSLRILKLAGLRITDEVAFVVTSNFEWQLWSIDLSDNKVGTNFTRILMLSAVNCRSSNRIQAGDHFEVEGKLIALPGTSKNSYYIDESFSSATFSHADRYLADPPGYNTRPSDHDQSMPGDRALNRLTGIEPVRGDSTDDTIRAMDGGLFSPVPNEIPYDYPSRRGVTHLHMNGLLIPASDVEALLVQNSGLIEHFECSQALMTNDAKDEWKDKTRWLSPRHVLYGFPGISYALRPVFQSNLRVLKMHHSLVTNVPTLESDDACAPENLWLAETRLREGMDLAYPQTYVPDMNPRLFSLTLSRIPLYSTGVVIERLISFLELAAAQEQGIERTRQVIAHHRGATVLRGLRQIRLEFDRDPTNELQALADDDDIAEAMNEFSLVSDNAWLASSSPSVEKTTESASTDLSPAPAESSHVSIDSNNSRRQTAHAENSTPTDYDEILQQATTGPTPAVLLGQRLEVFPFDHADGEYYNHPLPNDQEPLRVWIGPGVVGAGGPPAVDEYMRNLVALPAPQEGDEASTWLARPATPGQVVAGAPAGVLIYRRAWDRMLLPHKREVRRPSAAELRGSLRDVLGAIKAFRKESRARYAALVESGEGRVAAGVAHDYWKGRLDIELPAEPDAGSAEYWR